MRYVVFAILTITSFSARTQVVINEVCSANDSIIQSIEDRYDDWIEFYNTGSTAINLAGYTIERDEDYKAIWTFPNIVVQPNDFLTIFCPNKSLKQVMDHVEIPIPPPDNWKYQTDTWPFDPTWMMPGFDDSSWPTGPTGIGYGNDAWDSLYISTFLPPTNSVLLRKDLFIADTSSINFGLIFNIMKDGYVAYVNGVEVGRQNMAGSPPSNTDYAISEALYLEEATIFAGAENFVPGWNTIAVQVHTGLIGGANDLIAYPYMLMAMEDTSVLFPSPPYPAHLVLCDKGLHTNFNLSSMGQTLTLKDPSGAIVDQIEIGEIHTDHSRGRWPDGNDLWYVLDVPSPCATNTNIFPFDGYADPPVIEQHAQFFEPNMSVSMTNTSATANMYYTLDGVEPTTADNAYTGAFNIDSTVVVRARNYDTNPNLLPSRIVSTTFIRDSITLPIVSLTTDPYNLWDWNYGIYVPGPNSAPDPPYNGANFTQGWERQAHVDYFDENQLFGFGGDCKMKIHGNFSKSWPQKSFRVLANDDFGDTWFRFDRMFPNKTVQKFKSFNVRNAGIDWNTCHFRDGFMHLSTRGLNMDFMDYRPCVLMLNGDYFGVFGLRERQDEKYLATNNNVREDQIDLLRFEGDVMHGSSDHFFYTVDYIDTADLSVQSKFDYVANNLIDVDNVADYFITETFYANVDWIGQSGSNNIKFWRTHTPSGKWKYILWDVDLGTNLFGVSPASFDHLGEVVTYTNSNHIKIATGLIENPGYENYFINRYADLINTKFHENNTLSLVDEIVNQLAPEMNRHFNMWGQPPIFIPIFGISAGWASNTTEWTEQVDSLRAFLMDRPHYARDFVESNFNLNGQVDVTLDVYPEGAGTVQISTVVPDSLPWTGVYFDGNPVTITATANPGYKFAHWESTNIFTTPDSAQTINLNINVDDQFTAHFDVVDYGLQVYPNPFKDEFTLKISVPDDKVQAILRIHDINGRTVKNIVPSGSFMEHGDHTFTLNLAGDAFASGMYFISFTTAAYNETVKIIKIDD